MVLEAFRTRPVRHVRHRGTLGRADAMVRGPARSAQWPVRASAGRELRERRRGLRAGRTVRACRGSCGGGAPLPDCAQDRSHGPGDPLQSRQRPGRAGASGEAVLQYRHALSRDGAFGEAWINIAALQETAGRPAEAEASLRKALEARSDFDLALYNLALLLTRARRYAEALSVWDRYLAVRPSVHKATTAMRLRALCRFEEMTSFS